jgi:hypothetical protein
MTRLKSTEPKIRAAGEGWVMGRIEEVPPSAALGVTQLRQAAKAQRDFLPDR